MRTQVRVGDSGLLDRMNLPPGQLAVDTERKALRVYDGELQGGFEVLGNRAYEPPLAPGPQTLIAGDYSAGFYGEVGPDELISYGELSQQIGISAGRLAFDHESLWLKFSYRERVIFVAKKYVRSHIAWQSIYQAGAVYGSGDFGLNPLGTERSQDAQVIIDPYTLTVRLLKAGVDDPASTAGRELTDLITPIVDGTWASYSAGELGMSGGGHGRWPWAMETTALWGGQTRVRYGGSSVVHFNVGSSTSDSDGGRPSEWNSWRPVLEVVS